MPGKTLQRFGKFSCGEMHRARVTHQHTLIGQGQLSGAAYRSPKVPFWWQDAGCSEIRNTSDVQVLVHHAWQR